MRDAALELARASAATREAPGRASDGANVARADYMRGGRFLAEE